MTVTNLGAPRSSLDRVVDALDAAGRRYELRGNHVQASCPGPSHRRGDRNPSLSIDYEDGRTRVHCMGGCDDDEVVLDCLGLTWAMLHDDWLPPEEFKAAREQSPTPLPKRRPKAAARRPRLARGPLPGRLTETEARDATPWEEVGVWEFYYADGTLAQREVKKERQVELVDPVTGDVTTEREKTFRPLWPNPNGGKWLTTAPKGYTAPLYRAPELAGWIEQGVTIHLGEGPKDADSAAAAGADAATSNPSGSGSFTEAQAASLTGAHIVAWLDHDEAGYKRGLALHDLLSDTAASLRLVLPVVDHPGADATDHLDAGHGLGDGIEVGPARLRVLVSTCKGEEEARLAGVAAAEARARVAAAEAAEQDKVTQDHQRHAARWAGEAGKWLDKLAKRLRNLGLDADAADLAERFDTALAAARDAVRDAYGAAAVEVPEYTAALLVDDDQDADDSGGAPDNLVEHPTARRNPIRFEMDQGVWAYSVGEPGQMRRGVYRGYTASVADPETGSEQEEQRWKWVAPLPYVHARVRMTDGEDNPTGTLFLVSAREEDSKQVLIGWDELRNHSWINILDLAAPMADKILRAASTAITRVAQDAELRCATPQVGEDGRLEMPKRMSIGYLETSEATHEEAIGTWRQIVTLAAENPRMALVLGAAAAAPFLSGLGQQPHVFHIHGEAQAGKTTAMTTAAAIWGFPGEGDSKNGHRIGVRLAWNTTRLGVPALLGGLGIMPAFFDEIGQAGDVSEEEWHQQISNIAQGAFRLRSTRVGGVQIGRLWRGIFFSTGNAEMLGETATGRNAGTPRRIVELEAPFTNSLDHNEAIEGLIPGAYGHLGHEIVDRYPLGDVQEMVAAARAALGEDWPSKHHDAMARHLALHLAGARMLDEVCGTGQTMFTAALIAAAEHLDKVVAPQHDADVILQELTDALGREPSVWPSRALYREHQEEYSAAFGDNSAPGRLRGAMKGLHWQDAAGETWIAVFTDTWKALCSRLRVESRSACRELDRRGLLHLTPAARANNVFVTQENTAKTRMYQIRIPRQDDDAPQLELLESAAAISTPSEANSGPDDPECRSECRWNAGRNAGTNPALTSNNAGNAGNAGTPRVHVRTRGNSPTGDGDTTAMACLGCGEPTVFVHQGQPLHPTCTAPEPAEVDATRPGEPDAPSEALSADQTATEAPSVPEAPAAPPEAAEAPSRAPESHQRATPTPKRGRGRSADRAAMAVEDSEVREAQKWAEASGAAYGLDPLTEQQASAVVERFHQVTGCRWKGAHGTIWALLTGHTKWPGAKSPQAADLGLFDELRDSDPFWTARSWILEPGDPAQDASIVGADVNAQYVAAGASVEVGEGDPVHYEPSDELPANVLRMPGWVRLRTAVEGAPHGLDLVAGMWVPTPLATYLTRDHGRRLDLVEALVWESKRKSLANLSRHFRDWSTALKPAPDPASRYALAMVKTLYTKGLGGYLASQVEGLTPPEWHRPDWAMLLRAQAEANMLRALDRLPAGCIARAKYADAAFIEVPASAADAWQAVAAETAAGEWSAEHAQATGWTRTDRDDTPIPLLDPIKPGLWKLMGLRPAEGFRGLGSAEAWRATFSDDGSGS